VRKNLLLNALCILAAIQFVSCRTPSAGVVVENFDSTTITVNSKVVGRKARVLKYNVETRNDLLLAQITIQNAAKDDLQFEYRFRWYDKDRIWLDVVEPLWIPVSISAKDQIPLNAIANNKTAHGFDFQIRYSLPSMRWRQSAGNPAADF